MLALHRTALWEVGLFGAVLPALLLALVVRRVAEEVVPGSGLPVAASVGLGTLILPFATVYFAHVTASLLGFAAFALLFLRRRPVLAGIAAGFAVCVDFPLALVLAILAVYARPRAPAFLAGAVVGLLPLAAFDTWAFGNPFHLSYENAVRVTGKSGHDVLGANSSGFFGIGVPSLRTALELLASPRGLLLLSPVLLAALAGLRLLNRRGFRREAAVAVAVFAGFLVYNSGYYLPFGGYVPGPRFLIATIPFLGLGLAPAFAAWPLVTSALALFSVGAMTVATSAGPLIGNADTHRWVVRWAHGDFVQSLLTLDGLGHGWIAVLPFVAAVAAAAAAALLPPGRPRVALRTLVPLVCFAVFFHAAPRLLGPENGLVALVAVAAGLVAVAADATPLATVAGAPLLLLLLPGVAGPTESLLAATLALVALAAVRLRRRVRPAP